MPRCSPPGSSASAIVRYLVARYAALDVTWQLACTLRNSLRAAAPCCARPGQALKKLDVYGHPRSTGALETSAPLLGDEWMDYALTARPTTRSAPSSTRSTPFRSSISASPPRTAARDAPPPPTPIPTRFRRRLWNATMDGQYPTFSNTGTSGSGKLPVDAKFVDSPGAQPDVGVVRILLPHAPLGVSSRTSKWTAAALSRSSGPAKKRPKAVEYIVYVEKPGPVEIVLPKHSYDIEWINPANGRIRAAQEVQGRPLHRRASRQDARLGACTSRARAARNRCAPTNSSRARSSCRSLSSRLRRCPSKWPNRPRLRSGLPAAHVQGEGDARDPRHALHVVAVDRRSGRRAAGLARARHRRGRHVPHSRQPHHHVSGAARRATLWNLASSVIALLTCLPTPAQKQI